MGCDRYIFKPPTNILHVLQVNIWETGGLADQENRARPNQTLIEEPRPKTIAVREINHLMKTKLSNCSTHWTKPHEKQTAEAEAGKTALRLFEPKVMQ